MTHLVSIAFLTDIWTPEEARDMVRNMGLHTGRERQVEKVIEFPQVGGPIHFEPSPGHDQVIHEDATLRGVRYLLKQRVSTNSRPSL